jgi:hypothetical protein
MYSALRIGSKGGGKKTKHLQARQFGYYTRHLSRITSKKTSECQHASFLRLLGLSLLWRISPSASAPCQSKKPRLSHTEVEYVRSRHKKSIWQQHIWDTHRAPKAPKIHYNKIIKIQALLFFDVRSTIDSTITVQDADRKKNDHTATIEKPSNHFILCMRNSEAVDGSRKERKEEAWPVLRKCLYQQQSRAQLSSNVNAINQLPPTNLQGTRISIQESRIQKKGTAKISNENFSSSPSFFFQREREFSVEHSQASRERERVYNLAVRKTRKIRS